MPGCMPDGGREGENERRRVEGQRRRYFKGTRHGGDERWRRACATYLCLWVSKGHPPVKEILRVC